MEQRELDERLAAWANEQAELAKRAKAAGDERARSMALMLKNMYEAMLPTLAQRAPWALERCAEELAQRAQAHNERGDYDSADRCQVQRAAVERVRALLKEET